MCGIGGFVGHYRPETLPHFLAGLAHRGPDGSGVWQDRAAGVGLAHRRLSIIDLSRAASQPMAGVEGRYQVVFNGEIYNFKALQAQVADYALNADSDTAVLAPLFDRYGAGMLGRLQGIFAMAIWDREKREIFLARDHVGAKPLYYALTPEGLAFASELKVLAGLWGVDMTPDAAALGDYLTLLWSPGERTPAKGIRKLLPGHWLKARLDGQGRVQYETAPWFVAPLPELHRGQPVYDETITPAQLRDLLDDIVAEQCTSDVPVGAFLSGGVDSSALVASMVANAAGGRGPRPAMTYCIGFSGSGMAAEGFEDDLHYARMAATWLDVPLTEMMVDTTALLTRLPDLAAMLDEPTADPAPLLVADISARARADGIKVLLSGAGGDDVMTGYRRHMSARLRQWLGPLCRPVGAGLGIASRVSQTGWAQGGQGGITRRLQQLGPLLRVNDEDFLVQAFMTNSLPEAAGLLQPDLRAARQKELSEGWRNHLIVAREQSRGQDLINRLLQMELAGFLPDHNLNYTDKAGMAHGVEIRVPLTDRRLMELMSRVDPKNKLHRTRLKAFFKDSMNGRLPPAVLHRSKAGFGAPLRGWMLGAGRGVMQNVLFSSPANEWFDAQAVESLWQRTQAGKGEGSYTLLAVAMCVWWKESMRLA